MTEKKEKLYRLRSHGMAQHESSPCPECGEIWARITPKPDEDELHVQCSKCDYLIGIMSPIGDFGED